jgi:multiple sugar transport system ATP-binding protein
MDEPLSNLDSKLRAQMRDEIVQLHRKSGAAFVYVTHDHVEAMTMASRIAVIVDGELLQLATPNEIYDNPTDLRVAELIGQPAINVLPSRITSLGVEFGRLRWPLEVKAPVQSAVQIAFRPEAVGLSLDPEAHRDAARVIKIERLGAESHVHVKLAERECQVVARVPANQQFAVDDSVQIAVAASSLLVFDAAGKRLHSRERMVRQGRPREAAR